jgi:hypothetical protein
MSGLSRRTFLRGALAVSAAVTVPMALHMPLRPVLWGDGIHDDTDAFQAMIDREPVDIISDAVRLIRSEAMEISGGVFRLSKQIVFRNSGYLKLSYIHFIVDDMPKAHDMVRLQDVVIKAGNNGATDDVVFLWNPR